MPEGCQVEFADSELILCFSYSSSVMLTNPRFSILVGCGYGGFLVNLGETYPDKYSIGMEIRLKVSDYVKDRIEALRHIHPNQYQNIQCIRTNSMKYITNYFAKGQLTKMFFLYPDPHFKKSKHKWRIINSSLLSEYAYVLRKGVSWNIKYLTHEFAI